MSPVRQVSIFGGVVSNDSVRLGEIAQAFRTSNLRATLDCRQNRQANCFSQLCFVLVPRHFVLVPRHGSTLQDRVRAKGMERTNASGSAPRVGPPQL
jgi:hypothetical protein